MKIISKYKDYYDYLTGIYGEDPLIIFDRRVFDKPLFRWSRGKLCFHIGGYYFEGFYENSKMYFGDDMLQFKQVITKPSRWARRFDVHSNHTDEERFICINLDDRRAFSVLRDIQKDKLNLNDKFGIPVIVYDNTYRDYWNSERDHFHNCILSDLNVSSFIKPETMYRWIYDWLSEQRTKAEARNDNQTDIQKLESKGFDKKSSFRPNMK